MKSLSEVLAEYAENISKIRVLSALKTDENTTADSYSEMLKADYEQIGRLSVRCKEILADYLYPILNSEGPIAHETVICLQDFCDVLIDPPSGEELDLMLVYEVSERLLKEEALIGDTNRYAHQLNLHITACYANVNRTSRVTVSSKARITVCAPPHT